MRWISVMKILILMKVSSISDFFKIYKTVNLEIPNLITYKFQFINNNNVQTNTLSLTNQADILWQPSYKVSSLTRTKNIRPPTALTIPIPIDDEATRVVVYT